MRARSDAQPHDRSRVDRLVRGFLLTLLYLAAAAAAYHGFYGKWGLRDNQPQTSIAAMLDGTADRPFVYRQLLPRMARATIAILPAGIERKLQAKALALRTGVPGRRTELGLWRGDADRPTYAAPYYIVYLLGFFFLFASLFLIRRSCQLAGVTASAAAAAPVAFALCLPMLQSVGGFVYDFSELFFLFAGLCCALPGRRWLLVPIAAVAAFNKESYLFFVLALIPLYVRDARDRRGIAVIATAALGAGAVYLAEKLRYAGNGGGDVMFQLAGNLVFYTNPLNLFRVEISYGVPLFAGYSLPTLAAVAALVLLGWRRLPHRLRLFTLACAAINVPLLLLFAAPGSTRNLSFLYPSLVFLIAAAMDRMREETDPVLRGEGLAGIDPAPPPRGSGGTRARPMPAVRSGLDSSRRGEAEDHEQQEQRNRDEEEDLRDTDERAANAAEAHGTENQPGHQEDESPFEHVPVLLLFKPGGCRKNVSRAQSFLRPKTLPAEAFLSGNDLSRSGNAAAQRPA